MIRSAIAASRPAHDPLRERAAASQRWPAAAWLALGFLAGIVFWHGVGFWSFVKDAVYQGDEDKAVLQQAQPAAPPPSEPLRPRASAASTKASCVALVIDRVAGTTRQAACPVATFHHRNGGFGIKRDREPRIVIEAGQGIAGWTTWAR